MFCVFRVHDSVLKPFGLDLRNVALQAYPLIPCSRLLNTHIP